jgi:hypothetical protein
VNTPDDPKRLVISADDLAGDEAPLPRASQPPSVVRPPPMARMTNPVDASPRPSPPYQPVVRPMTSPVDGGRPPGTGTVYPGAGPVYMQSVSTNGLAIASMILGILWLYWLGSILALIFGYVALSQIRRRGDGGRGMAIAGIILGWIGVIVAVAAVILVIVAAHHDNQYGNYN